MAVVVNEIEGNTNESRPIPWQWITAIVAVVALLAIAGLIFLFLEWRECLDEVAALEQQIVELNEAHAAQVQALVDEIAKLNDEKAALEQEVARLETELEDCQNSVEGLEQRADRLEAELDACIKELNQPRRIQVVLPELLRDDTTHIFVIDDSGSMATETINVQEALQNTREKPAVNASLSIMLFGDSYQTLFNFTDQANAPWDYAISEIRARHGGTDIDLALKEAFDSIKDEPNANKRIVLLSDGHGFVNSSTLAEISAANIPVDTIGFGALADYALLSKVAQSTGGEFKAAN